MEIIPSDLATYGGEAKRLLQDLQTRNERMFLVTILLMNTASTRQKLENAVFQTASIAQKYNRALKRLDFQQEEGLMSSLPISINQIEIERVLTTSSTAAFAPSTTQELFQYGREGLEDCADWTSSRMLDILGETRGCVLDLMKDARETFHAREREVEDTDTVTIPKEDYKTMIDDLLVMSELIQMVSDMRTRDVEIIQELSKFVPAFAAFEKNRLSIYREAAKEAEGIYDLWADEDDEFEVNDIDVDDPDDEDYEPDEYFSD